MRRTRGKNSQTNSTVNKHSHGKEERTAPLCADEYNQYMGAVDRSNALRSGSSLQLKHKYRWYMCLIYYCIDILLINSYLVYKHRYKRDNFGKTAPSQREYRIQLIKAITLLRTQIKYDDSSFISPSIMYKKRKKSLSVGSNSVSSRISYNEVWETIDNEILQKIPQRYTNVGHHFPIIGQSNTCKWCFHYDKKEENRVVSKCRQW